MYFSISSKKLTSLKDVKFPPDIEVLNCDFNQLTSLEGCPYNVTKICCVGNQLTSLEGCPQNVIEIYCSVNQLTTLDGIEFYPSVTILNCSYNRLTSLKGCPPSVKEIYCDGNPLIDQYKNKTLKEIHNINRIKALKKGISLINNLLSALKIQRCWRKWWYEELDSEGVNRFIRESFIEFNN